FHIPNCALLHIDYLRVIDIILFFFFMLLPPPTPTLFPYTTLFRSITELSDEKAHQPFHFPWPGEKPMSYVELQLYNMRHVQEHRSEEHTSELQSRGHLVCRLLLEKKKTHSAPQIHTSPRDLFPCP